MINFKNDKGITLISLAITIVIMLILTVTVTMSMKPTIEINKYNEIKEDIIELSEEVKIYYLNNNKLPVYEDNFLEELPSYIPKEDINPNDEGRYYYINPSYFTYLDLNCGEGNKNKDYTTDDIYVVNEKSLTVYYLKGAILDDKTHYTIVDDFAGGSYAEDYYAKADLPIISVVTMESNGKDKTLAGLGDIITLKILSNYEFTTAPTITINGETVPTVWNGNVGIATYSIPLKIDAIKYDEKIPFSISGYYADDREGEEITEVTFGQEVYTYCKSIVELYKLGVINIGDYVAYTYDEDKPNYTKITEATTGTDNDLVDGLPQTDGLKWQILNIDEETGMIDLVSETATNDTIKLSGALGYNNGVYLLNDICAQHYSNSALGITARSINIEDTEKHLTPDGIATKTEFTSSGGIKYGDTKTYTGDNSYYPNIYAQQNGSGINIDTEGLNQDEIRTKLKKDGIGESDSYYKEPTTETYTPASGTATSENSITLQQTSYLGITFDTTNYGDVAPVLYSSSLYWVASRYFCCGADYAQFGLLVAYKYISYGIDGLFNSNVIDKRVTASLRPVVSLKSDMLNIEIGKNADEAWQLKTNAQ